MTKYGHTNGKIAISQLYSGADNTEYLLMKITQVYLFVFCLTLLTLNIACKANPINHHHANVLK